MFVMFPMPQDINRYQVGFFTPERAAVPSMGGNKAQPRIPLSFQTIYHNIGSEDAAHVVSFLNGGALSDIAHAQINAANLAGEEFRSQLQVAAAQDAAAAAEKLAPSANE